MKAQIAGSMFIGEHPLCGMAIRIGMTNKWCRLQVSTQDEC